MRYIRKEVGSYWWFKTPEMKLTEPVLRTKECCYKHANEIFNIELADYISSLKLYPKERKRNKVIFK
jgi:hypothetical protein